MIIRKRYLTFLFLMLALFFIGAPLLSRLEGDYPKPTTFILFSFLIIVWTVSSYYRIVNHAIARYCVVMGLLMLSWILLQNVKYDCIGSHDPYLRFCWYLFYVPMLLLPYVTFLSSLHLGRPDGTATDRRWYALLVPCALLILCFLTNDWHQLAFRFRPGFDAWTNHYSYGPIYILGVLWISGCLSAALVIAIQHSGLNGIARRSWIPFLPILLSILYYLLYPSSTRRGTVILQLPEMFCFMMIGFFEGCLLIGLIPSNTGYGHFFTRSHLAAQIVDRDGNVTHSARESIPASGIWQNHVLHRMDISGGQVLWAEDLTEINRLNRELNQANLQLADESDLLEAENRLKEERAQIAEQSRIYDSISALVAPQTERIAELVRCAEQNPDRFPSSMAAASLLTVYIKRRANLTLLASRSAAISSRELQLSIAESLDYLAPCGVPADLTAACSSELPAPLLLAAYDAFESVIESVLPDCQGIMIRLSDEAGAITLRFSLEIPRLPPLSLPSDFSTEQWDEDGVVYLQLTAREVAGK